MHRVALVLLHHLLEWAVGGQRRWWLVVLSPPSHHLLHPVLLCKRALVISREEARMLLVEPCIFVQRHPALVCAREREAGGTYRSPQTRTVDRIKVQPFRLEEPPCLAGLGNAALCEIHVHPASETVCQIPLTLPMPHKHEICMRRLLHAKRATSRQCAAAGARTPRCGSGQQPDAE